MKQFNKLNLKQDRFILLFGRDQEEVRFCLRKILQELEENRLELEYFKEDSSGFRQRSLFHKGKIL